MNVSPLPLTPMDPLSLSFLLRSLLPRHFHARVPATISMTFLMNLLAPTSSLLVPVSLTSILLPGTLPLTSRVICLLLFRPTRAPTSVPPCIIPMSVRGPNPRRVPGSLIFPTNIPSHCHNSSCTALPSKRGTAQGVMTTMMSPIQISISIPVSPRSCRVSPPRPTPGASMATRR